MEVAASHGIRFAEAMTLCLMATNQQTAFTTTIGITSCFMSDASVWQNIGNLVSAISILIVLSIISVVKHGIS